MSTIYLKKNEVYRTRIEDITNKNQFFFPVYEQARDSLWELITYSQQFWDEYSKPNSIDQFNINPMRLRGYPNNIIAFCADRGHGKTSAMLSFSKSLTVEKKVGEFWKNTKINDFRFFALEPIDPTVLENTDHIIPTIISRMFTVFTEKVNELRQSTVSSGGSYRTGSIPISHHDLRDKQQSLLQLFQECYRLADEQKDNKKRNDSYDDLQLLADRGDSSNFKVRFWELVKEYLYFMECGRSSPSNFNCLNSFLVIQIDDADMNPEHAYDVVEDLRKYCVLPNVVVLFATNLDQLEMCVEQHFVKSFNPLINSAVKDCQGSPNTASANLQHCHQTTVSYMDKLIPSMHRINLPDINNTLQNYGSSIFLHHDQFHAPDHNPVEYQNALISILKDRCLMRLQTESGRLHPFLPKRMRELTHFLNRMNSMEEIGSLRALLRWTANNSEDGYSDNSALKLKKNLEYLMDYLVYDWCDLALEPMQRKVIRDIHHAATNRKVEVALEQLRQIEITRIAASHAPSTKTNSTYPTCEAHCPTVTAFKNKAITDDPHCEITENHTNMVARKTPPSYNQSANKWGDLLKYIEALHIQEKSQFACALELYFAIIQELLLVGSCITQKELLSSSSSTEFNAMSITTLGDCNINWHNPGDNPMACMGGFDIDLRVLRQNIATMPVENDSLSLFLNTYFYLEDDSLNPSNQKISTLFANDAPSDTPIKVIFDPLHFTDSDWDTLYVLYSHSGEDDEYSHMVDFADARLTMFANPSLQLSFRNALSEKCRSYESNWVHFRDRFRHLWELSNSLCIGIAPKTDLKTASMLDWIFLSNETNKIVYLQQVKSTVDDGSLLCRLNYIKKLIKTASDAISLCSSDDEYHAQIPIISSAAIQIHGLWADSFREINALQDLLDTPMTSKFYTVLQEINSIILSSHQTFKLNMISTGEISTKNAVEMLDKLLLLVQNINETWIKWMGKNAGSLDTSIQNADQALIDLENWITSKKSVTSQNAEANN